MNNSDPQRQDLIDLDRQLFTTAHAIDRYRTHDGEEGWGGPAADRLRSLLHDLRQLIAEDLKRRGKS